MKQDRYSSRIFAFLDLHSALHPYANTTWIYDCSEWTMPDILTFLITVIEQNYVTQEMEK
jgi:hypothetical protein